MKMLRHYFLGSDLDDMELLEEQLEDAGVATPQIHVLTMDDTAAENHHHLHDVQSLVKKDLLHSGLFGAAIGVCLAALVLIFAYSLGWTESAAGWMPFIFLAIILLGFSTWEGGLWGIQTTNVRFRRFEDQLKAGRHVFFVDLLPDQEEILKKLLTSHTQLEAAGTGAATPYWIMVLQQRIRHLFGVTLP